MKKPILPILVTLLALLTILLASCRQAGTTSQKQNSSPASQTPESESSVTSPEPSLLLPVDPETTTENEPTKEASGSEETPSTPDEPTAPSDDETSKTPTLPADLTDEETARSLTEGAVALMKEEDLHVKTRIESQTVLSAMGQTLPVSDSEITAEIKTSGKDDDAIYEIHTQSADRSELGQGEVDRTDLFYDGSFFYSRTEEDGVFEKFEKDSEEGKSFLELIEKFRSLGADEENALPESAFKGATVEELEQPAVLITLHPASEDIRPLVEEMLEEELSGFLAESGNVETQIDNIDLVLVLIVREDGRCVRVDGDLALEITMTAEGADAAVKLTMKSAIDFVNPGEPVVIEFPEV